MDGGDGGCPADAPPTRRLPFTRRDAATGLLTGLVMVLLGVPVGLAWAVLSPRVAVTVTTSGVDLVNPESDAAFSADMAFLFAALAVGVLAGLAAWWLARRSAPGVVAGLALGGVAGGVVAVQIGQALYAGTFRQAVAAASTGTRLSLSPTVHAHGMLLGWPLAALLVFTALYAWRGAN